MDENAEFNELNINNLNRICCVGASRIGILNMVVMASHWPNKTFVVYDRDAVLIETWNANGVDNLPFFEQGLGDLVMQQRGVNLFSSNDLAEAMQNAPIVFVAINIKTKTYGEGKKGRLDLTEWEIAVNDIKREATEAKYIVEKSPFPADVPNYILEILGQNPPGHNHQVYSNPEFFSQGTAIQDLQNPARVVIARKTGYGNVMVLRDLYHQWVPLERIIIIGNFKSVDLGTVAANVILAMKITVMNICSVLCDDTGANILEVRNIVGTDVRIGERHVNPSAGIGGPSLQRDVAYMAYMATYYNRQPAAKLLKNVIEFNKKRKENFVKIMLEKMISLKGKTVVVFGFSYKKFTDDIADSPALYFCERLYKNEHAIVRIYDTLVPPRLIESCFPESVRNAGRLIVIDSNAMQQAWVEADAICFLLDYVDFTQNINFQDVYEAMNRPAFFFNFCNGHFDHEHIGDCGFRVYVAGCPAI